MNVVYRFFSTLDSFGPTLLRLLLATVFLVHSAQNTLGLFGGAGWAATMARWTSTEGMNIPYPVALGLSVAETAGALGLLAGFLTRLAALGVFAVMVVSIIALAHLAGAGAATPQQSVESSLVLSIVALSLVFMGGGKLSIDKAITRQLLPPYSGMLMS